jgi:DNA-binding CsgD family transcriptional regulator
VTLLALTSAALGDAAVAAGLYEELLPLDGRNIVLSEGVVCIGAASYYLGILAGAAGRFDDAERHFRQAIAMNGRTGARPWLALAQHDYGKMLLSRRAAGDRRVATALLEECVSGARQLGMGELAAKAERLLAPHKARGAALPDGLTRREAEVLRMIAAGMSNRDISAMLVLSLRTTARHVTNIYAKIGARNRAEATSYAIRQKLLEP